MMAKSVTGMFRVFVPQLNAIHPPADHWGVYGLKTSVVTKTLVSLLEMLSAGLLLSLLHKWSNMD